MPSRTRPVATGLLLAGLLTSSLLAAPTSATAHAASQDRRDPTACGAGYQLAERAVLRDRQGRRLGRAALRFRTGETPGYCLRVRIAPRFRSRHNVVLKQLAVREGDGSAAVAVRQPTSRQTPLTLPAADLDTSLANAVVVVSLGSQQTRVRLRRGAPTG